MTKTIHALMQHCPVGGQLLDELLGIGAARTATWASQPGVIFDSRALMGRAGGRVTRMLRLSDRIRCTRAFSIDRIARITVHRM